jgi:hypothetical protein
VTLLRFACICKIISPLADGLEFAQARPEAFSDRYSGLDEEEKS